ncbi:MAG: hypothetical protein DHS20C21_12500 [Gemmatimonadota bacterium]|nr:MAG: hypothetical protein DHS20C21_12500 [Gemmatimonadota bacterium]
MSASRSIVVHTNGPEETQAVGAAFAKSLTGGATLSLEGPLGAGKTVLVRGLCDGLGVTDAVTSPTYTLENEYATDRGTRVIHVDCFRLGGPGELEDLGIDDRRDAATVVVVEWGDRALAALPGDTIRVTLTPDPGEESRRRIAILVPAGVEIPGLGGGEES